MSTQESTTQKTLHKPEKKNSRISNNDNIHGIPTEIPLLPIRNSKIIEITQKIQSIDEVISYDLRDSREWKEALKIGYKTTANCTPEESKELIETKLHLTDPIKFTVTDGNGIYKTINGKPDGVIEVYEHPAVHQCIIACNKSLNTHPTQITWDVDVHTLDSDPTHIAWEKIQPLEVTIELPENKSVTTLTQSLKEILTGKHPSQYFPVINTTDSTESTDQTVTVTIKYKQISSGNPESRNAIILQGNANDIQSVTEKTDTKTLKTRATGPRTIDNAILSENGEELSAQNITGKIQLTVTSPPYLDAINYSAYESTKSTDYSQQQKNRDSKETHSVDKLLTKWKSQQKEIFSNVFDITKPGGYCAVIIGPTKSNGEMVNLPAHFTTMMRDIGWVQEDIITWHKITGGNDRFGTTIQHPHPTYYNSNQLTEQIGIWRKGDPVKRKFSSTEFELNEFFKKEVANNIWHIPPTPPNKDSVDHPCPYPEEIPHRLVNLYTYPGDTVFDPMAGSGTTIKVANNLDRNAIGIELQAKFVREARRRTHFEAYNRSSQKIPEWDDTDSENASLTQSKANNVQSRFTDYTN